MLEFSTEINKDTDLKAGHIYLLNKPLNWTSFDLVKKVKSETFKCMGVKKLKVGHAGTLDPLATGLMIVCVGKATKKIPLLQNMDKEYIAEIELGIETPSYDLETEVISRGDASVVTEAKLVEVLNTFLGEQDQIPPIFSAKKIKGEKAYDIARRGDTVEMKSSRITISEIELVSFDNPKATFKVRCSKGTYIRSLANDIGKKLECGACLTGLKRTFVSGYKLEDALEIDVFTDMVRAAGAEMKKNNAQQD